MKEIFQIVFSAIVIVYLLGNVKLQKDWKLGERLKKKKDMMSDTVYWDTTRRCLRITIPP